MMRKAVLLVVCYFLIFTLTGCEAFVKKFTRKPKDEKKEEMVLVPQDYKDSMSPEERYRQYYTFWKSWQDELSVSLLENRSLKKRLDCADQAIKNLEELRRMLNNEEKQKLMDKYIQESKRLRNTISNDIYGNYLDDQRSKADSIKRNVARYFTYSEIKDFVVK